jgi:hypothetical protein
VIDAGLLCELSLRHLLGLELGSKPFIECAAVLAGHCLVRRSVRRARGVCRAHRTIPSGHSPAVSPVRTPTEPSRAEGWVGCGAVCHGSGVRRLGAAVIERLYDTQEDSDAGAATRTVSLVGRWARGAVRDRHQVRWSHHAARSPASPWRSRPPMYTPCLASGIAARFRGSQALLARPRDAGRAEQAQPAGSGSGLCPGPSNPSPRRLPETEYATEPNTMIERTLITRSTRVIAIASVGEMP